MKLKFDRMSLRYSSLLGRLVVGAGLIAASVAAASSPSALAAPKLVNDPGSLRSVTCTSPTNCWAVGDAGMPAMAQSLALHFNGATWSPVTVPHPEGTSGVGVFSALNSVRCLNANDCWAVGNWHAPRLAENNLALHWNGQKWKLFSAPNPGGVSSGSFSDLTDVSCTSKSSCWAVGDSGLINPVVTGPILKQVNEALRWNGHKWSLVKVPNPAGTGMGDTDILNAVRCTSASSCWAAGDFGPQTSINSRLRDLMLRWNGKKWQTSSIPNPGGTGNGDDNELAGLSCPSARNCWAVGTFGRINSPGDRLKAQDLVLHFNGRSWSKAKAPNPDGTGNGKINLLNGVTCSSSTNCWAVGQFGQGPASNSALRWNGKNWQEVTTPNPGLTTNDLLGARCTGLKDCFAVGVAFTAGDPEFAELLRWNGQKWAVS